MTDLIKITLIANAGVLVEYNGTGILVDGIHHEEGHPFSRVSKVDMRQMRYGEGLFQNLDYLLFTHEHPDHFTPQYVLKHIQCRSVKGLFLPCERDGSSDLVFLFNHARIQEIPCWSMGLEPGKSKYIELTEDLSVTTIGSRHMGPQYEDIRNDCFLLTLKGMNLLFTGDADYVSDFFEKALAEVNLDAVFVNPIFYHNPGGQAIINEIFKPATTVIYHMPPADEDTMQFSFMVKRDIQRYERPDIQTHVLNAENSSIFLSVHAKK
ncbi:MBL fold metallo-hydrolase [Maridesulfovibrio zosterae]|uniref:MBL fold metallo-hydrolase n=1 Tax=Maridesulfovibrio zosterae TaxID=82171 RepID=UPI00041C8E06|nr:MBL fold metallo-hydrolase [Maridesulfovibrio zosterae]